MHRPSSIHNPITFNVSAGAFNSNISKKNGKNISNSPKTKTINPNPPNSVISKPTLPSTRKNSV
jgi:hypothetical protein